MLLCDWSQVEVSGVMLVTPSAVLFEADNPDTSGDISLTNAAVPPSDTYNMIAPMESIVSVAVSHDLSAMTNKR